MSTIAIFDSGVGGLSVYKEIKALLPQHDYLFVSDNLGFPYGNKTADKVQEKVVNLIDRTVSYYQPDIAVIACNTASTIVLPTLRAQHNIPIVGVVPAIKPAASISVNKHIAVLATPATIKRIYTQQLIDQFAYDCQVIKLGSSRLVDIAEAKLYGTEPDLKSIEAELAPILASRYCDTIVLACTHFPLLNNEIESIIKSNNRNIFLVDSGRGIANRVASLMNSNSSSAIRSKVSIAVFSKAIASNSPFLACLNSLDLAYGGVLAL